MPAALSIGKRRGLQRISNAGGAFTCLALDHRQNLRRSLNPADPNAVSDASLSDFKLEVVGAIAEEATAVLLDPEYGAAQAIAAGIITDKTGLVVALEATGYTGAPAARQSRVLPGWSVEKVKRMGADAIKLLVYYHPDSATASEIEAFVRYAAEECETHDIALMLEPLSYSLDPAGKLTSSEKRTVVVETARRLTPLGADLLKAEFPAHPDDEKTWAAACAEISAASAVPWIILSAAVDYETFLRQVWIAGNAGASGVAVGRAVWKEAVGLPAEKRSSFLNTTARERLAGLTALCSEHARPWTDIFPPPEISSSWYKEYGEK